LQLTENARLLFPGNLVSDCEKITICNVRWQEIGIVEQQTTVAQLNLFQQINLSPNALVKAWDK
jgi:hypothetical protein